LRILSILFLVGHNSALGNIVEKIISNVVKNIKPNLMPNQKQL